jgi:hypothetical protein
MAEAIAHRFREDGFSAEQLAEARDINLHRAGGGSRWVVAPQGVRQPVPAHGVTAVHRENSEDSPVLRSRDGALVPIAVEPLERSQQTQLHAGTVRYVATSAPYPASGRLLGFSNHPRPFDSEGKVASFTWTSSYFGYEFASGDR